MLLILQPKFKQKKTHSERMRLYKK